MPVPRFAGYQRRVVASGATLPTVRTPTGNGPLGAGRSDDDLVVVGLVDPAGAGVLVAARSVVELPQAASVTARLTPAMAVVKGLRFMSVRLSGQGGSGAGGEDDLADRVAGLCGGRLVFGEHRVLGVGQNTVDAVGRQGGELVLQC